MLVLSVDFVIQQSTGATATTATLSNERVEYIKKLGLSAKENMTFTGVGHE